MKIAVLILLALLIGCGDKDDEKAAHATAAAKADSDDQSPGVTLRKDAQQRAGLRVEQLESQDIHPESIAYGRLEEDPSESFTVRAPVSGTLRASVAEWPSINRTVAAGSQLGAIEPRLPLADRISLSNQISTARADLNASTAAVAAAQKAYDRASALNADNKNISDRALQEAEARLTAEKAREAGLRSSIQVLESSLAGAASASATPVMAAQGGEAVEILAQPGESVEQGASLMRLARFDHLLVRVDIPIGDPSPPRGAPARIIPAGFDSQAPLTAEALGPASAAGANTNGIALLYRLSGVRAGLRPGMAVTARFSRPGTGGAGVLIPRAALVQQDGRLWAYVQTGDDRFSRRPVPLDTPTAEGYLTSKGFSGGDRIVVTGAQTLLSEEFKSRNEVDTN